MTPMEELKAFIKALRDEEEREAFADRCETSIGHLRNVAYGKPCSEKLASLIEAASGRRVRRWHLRPDDWHIVWPELVGKAGAPRPKEGAAA